MFFMIIIIFNQDDGNLIDGDGCSSECFIEFEWECKGGNITTADVCEDVSEFRFIISRSDSDSDFINKDENIPYYIDVEFT
jgi:hypothetical protein